MPAPSLTLYPSEDLYPSEVLVFYVDSGAALTGTATHTARGSVMWSEGANLSGAGPTALPKAYLIAVSGADLDAMATVVAEAIIGRTYVVPSETLYPGMELYPSAGSAPDRVDFEAHLVGSALVDILSGAVASSGAALEGIASVGADFVIALSSAADIEAVADVLLGSNIVDSVVVLTSTATLEAYPSVALSSGSKVTTRAYSEAEFPQGMRAAHKTMYEAGVD